MRNRGGWHGDNAMIKCKGCNGQIEYVPLAQVRELGEKDYRNAGPALVHDPAPGCKWFFETPNAQILAYINVAEYKAKNAATTDGDTAT